MAKYTHLTPAGQTYSVPVRQLGRVTAMCGQKANWHTTWNADGMESFAMARNVPPVCPKCAAILLIEETANA
jgi:hypothetical protein